MKTKVDDIAAYTPKNKNKIKVNQFGLDGKFIKPFDSIFSASKQTKSNPSGIWLCINDRAKSCNNFQWKKA